MDEKASVPIGVPDQGTLREVLLEPDAARAQAREGTPTKRIWALCQLGRLNDAAAEAEELLAGSDNRFGPLLLLAHIYQCQYRWDEAAWLQGEALRLARTPSAEAGVHHHTGRRLLEEGRHLEAAQEFEWAAALHRSAGSPDAEIAAARQAMRLAYRLAHLNTFDDERTGNLPATTDPKHTKTSPA
ncbi:hypothetical protein [Arthrobacter sp. VKM Ac-2550]|uniref:hypothetical protein n=1 Tax=Crystallibacter permensis TaxID=1938888 RepID=UPI002227050B|nr:hypothetical protein [Arthrobacter sp. VKM Ac-2550]MCW2134518.1 hypothetical protein [Arthrobacter sp. VKM Ac-2550]